MFACTDLGQGNLRADKTALYINTIIIIYSAECAVYAFILLINSILDLVGFYKIVCRKCAASVP